MREREAEVLLDRAAQRGREETAGWLIYSSLRLDLLKRRRRSCGKERKHLKTNRHSKHRSKQTRTDFTDQYVDGMPGT